MNKELETKLFERFFFYKPDRSIRESSMAFGFACGDGWFDIIWDLSEKIEKTLFNHIKENDLAKSLLSEEDFFNVVQVKEKFGTLRYYYDSNIPEETVEEIEKLVNEAEKKSSETCERCGKPGSLTFGGWVTCRCEKCLNEGN